MKEKITTRLPLFVTLFCAALPALDVLDYWLQTLGGGFPLAAALRIALSVCFAVLGFLLSDRKRYYGLLAGVLAVFTGLHALACAQGGYAEPLGDLFRLLQLYALPVTTLCFITFLKKNERVFPAMCRGMVIVVLTVAAVQLLSAVTGTDPHTYRADGTGILGWFSLPNGQSAILAMLTPITICWSLHRWKDKLLPVALLTAVSEAALFVLAPELAYGSLFAAGVGCAVCLLLVNRARWKQALAITLVTLVFLALWPLSPTRTKLENDRVCTEQAQNLTDYFYSQLFFVDSQIIPNTIAGPDGGEAEPVLEGTTADYLELLYRLRIPMAKMIDRFGRDRVFKACGYTVAPLMEYDNAAIKIKFCGFLMQDSGRLSRLFGLDPAQMRVAGNVVNGVPTQTDFDVENDFHGVYFHTGLVGLLLLAAFLLFFGVRALWRVISQPKGYFTLALASFALAYLLGVVHALLSDSVLRRGSAPVFFGLVLAGLWYLTRRTPEDKAAVSGMKPKERVLHHLPALVVFFCILQPVLDVIGYWQQELGASNQVTLVLRILLMAFSALLGFVLSDRKRYYILLAGILAALTGLHIAANLPGGYLAPVADLSNLLRIYFLPVTVFCFVTFLRSGGERVFRAIKIGMSADLALILLVELLSVLTGTNRGTYINEHIGVIGWFLWGNCQSAILSMLTVLVLCWSLLRWRDRLLPIALVTAAAEAALYFFGTRLAFASLAAVGLGVSVCLLLTDRRRWKQAVLIVLISAVFLGAYPLSPAARRLDALGQSAGQALQEPQLAAEAPPPEPEAPALRLTLLSAEASPPQPAEETPPPAAQPQDGPAELEATYRHYFNAVVNRFGIERVAEKYNYTTDPAVLGDARTCKRVVCELTMEDAPPLCRFFGLNVNRLRLMVGDEDLAGANVLSANYESFEMERDFHGIYYVLGLAGLALTVAFLLYFGLRALLRVLQDRRTYFTMELAGFAGAYAFALIHAWFTTAVLRRNNASIYLALVLAGLWYLTQKPPARKSAPEEDAPERRSYGAE